MNINGLTRSLARGVLQTKKNSPHIFFGLGLAGVVGGAVLACKSTLKLEETVDDIKQELSDVKELAEKSVKAKEGYSEQDHLADLGHVYIKSAVKVGKLYGPAIIVGGLGVAFLTGSHVQLTKRNTALTVTLAAVSKAYESYRSRIQEEIGTERELEVYHNVQEVETEVDGKKQTVKAAHLGDHSPYARFFDEFSTAWVRDAEMNRCFLQAQQNYANHILNSRGHVFLNDVYDGLGLERTSAGSVVGWLRDGDGDGHIDFGMYEIANARFINGLEKSILLDFNVDGVIYDKIDHI